MSTPPARCCAPATSGRCSNAPAPYGQSRYIGTVEIAACNHPKHQAALRSLPDFQRRAGVCGADDCGKAAESGLCPEHRQLYRRHGINIRALLAQETPMTDPITPAPADDGEPSAGDVADAQPTDPMQQRREAVVVRLLALGAEEQPGRHPTARVFVLKYEAYTVPDVSYSAKDMEAAMQSVERACDRLESFMAGKWSQKHTTPVQSMSADLDGLAALAAREVVCIVPPRDPAELLSVIAPTAPGPTVAELQQQLAAERARADLLDAEAVSQRQRAEAVEAELFELDHTLHTLGAHGTGSAKEWLLQVLTPEDRRAILEFDAAEARMDLARLRARARLNPAPPERVAELTAKVATLDARIAALDAG